MSTIEKLKAKLLSRPKGFTYSELHTLLIHFGYIEVKKGRTSGSRRAFFNEKTKNIIRLHKPHPKEILKRYQINMIIAELRKEELL